MASSRMLRIAFLSRIVLAHGLGGGMEQHGAMVSGGLTALGHEVVTITTAHPRGITALEDETGRTLFVDAPARRYSAAWWRESWNALLAEHHQRPFDVVLSQSAGGQAAIVRARRQLALPAVVVIHGTLGTEWRTRLQDLRSARGLYRMARYLYQLPPLLYRWRLMAASAERWITVSDELKVVCRRELGIPSERIVVVPNGIDTDRFQPDPLARQEVRRSLGIAHDVPVLVAVGRLEYEKGLHLALQALERLLERFPTAELLIAGEGAHGSVLEQQAVRLGGAARLLGHVEHARLPGLLAAADLFLLPTLRYEGLPMTAIEALACGLPVVGSRIGGVPSAVEHEQTGLLVEPGNVAALADAAAALLADAELRRRMSAAARKAAVERFSRGTAVRATERVLCEVVERGVV